MFPFLLFGFFKTYRPFVLLDLVSFRFSFLVSLDGRKCIGMSYMLSSHQ